MIETEEDQKIQYPDWTNLEPKFKTVDELEKAYGELCKQLTKGQIKI